MQIAEPYFSHYVKPLVFGLALLPALYFLAWAGWAHTLGANPIEAITRYLGDWALRFFADYFKHFHASPLITLGAIA